MKRGEVYWAQLDPTIGAEIQKTRPVVVMSNTSINKARRTIVVVPLSTSAPVIPYLNVGLTGGSTARCDHIRAIDKSRLGKKVGTLSSKDIDAIFDGLKRILDK
ncbi:MAG: type II toxin-antitoxin system PemK/MazF family toxin [Moraxellaceae bacterium]|nr:type II toxin-antitoxin system PemK/MazF family toxin [Moraxellaceae bacterium]MCP5177820.1 type II toxin-antitoxin system PemK/MazF family toxin [Moraxellaceae bacterium]